MKKYWHVTSIDNFQKIIQEGLKINEDGQLFLFDDKHYATSIVTNQCGLCDGYALFRIDKLDVSRLGPDNVAEWTASSQWIYDQNIPPSCLTFVNCYGGCPQVAKKQIEDNVQKNNKAINTEGSKACKQ